jgi:hypothetical protein
MFVDGNFEFVCIGVMSRMHWLWLWLRRAWTS